MNPAEPQAPGASLSPAKFGHVVAKVFARFGRMSRRGEALRGGGGDGRGVAGPVQVRYRVAKGAAWFGLEARRRGALRGGEEDRRVESDAVEPDVLDARLLPAAVCCWGATIVVLTTGWVTGLVVAAGLVLAAVGVGVFVRTVGDRWRTVALVVLAAVLLGAGFAVAAAWREQRVSVHPLRNAVGTSVWVVVTPGDDPKVLRSSGFGGERRWTVRAGLRESRRGDLTVRAGGGVVILAEGPEWGGVLPGQPIEFRARVEHPWHRDLTIVSLRALGPPRPAGALPWWQRVASSVRRDLAGAATTALPEGAAGLLPALVVGDTSALPDSVRKDFEHAGLQHLCVVSGANFTILLSVVLFTTRMLTLGPRLAATVAAAALLMFIVIARPDPSVLRAGAMGAITLLALVTGRRKQALPALCAAVIGLLALWPELAVSAGFALSTVATAGLILLAPSWADWLRARGWSRLPAEIVAVSAGAFVVTVPIMVALTGRVSIVAVLANILVAPVIAPITVIGALGAATSCVWPPLAAMVLHCAAPPLWWLLAVAERAADFPGATMSVPGGAMGGLLTAAFVALTVCALRSAAVRMLMAAVIVGSAAVLIPARIWHPGWPPEGWILAACDVGQGDGLALSLGDGVAIVIDVGPDPRVIRTCLNRLRIKRIALLVLTHPHADHIGGLTGAVDGRTVAALAVAPHELDGGSGSGSIGGVAHPEPLAKDPHGPAPGGRVSTGDPRGPADGPAQIAAIASRSAIPVLELSAGHLLHFGTIELEVLAPAAAPNRRSLSIDDANDRSLVIAATTPAGRILLTGDIEAPAQHLLLSRGAALRSDILKVPHHGSRTTTKEFLSAVHPRLALVTVGADNTFGHPHPEILADLHTLGATVARTDRDGDLLVIGPASRLHLVTSGPSRTRRRFSKPDSRIARTAGPRARSVRPMTDPCPGARLRGVPGAVGGRP
ncbi:ComEC/Rec2 family competence protein [Nocardia sp. NPDC050710]|uniref:ComEC/Rec2 family competence protein n=1 Tax=Nocardia sp. NPDC050710 TaxID=3157220 RepID=UPI0033C2B4E4